MTTVALRHFDTQGQKLVRWTGAGGIIVALHASAAALALWYMPENEPPREERPGAIMMELPALAAESPSDQPDLADQPEFTQSAPPPSQAAETQEPPENEPAEETPPVEEKVAEAPAPQPALEPVSEPLPDLPPVEEAPLAPEPEVALPKEMPPEPPKPEKEKPVETAEEKPAETPPKPKPAQKTESRQQRKAAASAQGKFDPNPIYRAKPAYPASARASKIQGTVVVSYSVSASGAVSNVHIVSASPPGIFNSATIAAVHQWRFKPSPSGAQGRRTTIRFKLN